MYNYRLCNVNCGGLAPNLWRLCFLIGPQNKIVGGKKEKYAIFVIKCILVAKEQLHF